MTTPDLLTKSQEEVENIFGLEPGRGKYAFKVSVNRIDITGFRVARPSMTGVNSGGPEFLVSKPLTVSGGELDPTPVPIKK